MKHIIHFLLLIFCLTVSVDVYGRDCGSCHGTGYRRVFVGTGSINASKKQCQYCHQICDLSSDHYCRCTTCGGSGQVGSSGGGSGFTLYPSEAQNVQQIIQLLNFGEAYYPPCSVCKGSGKCPHCGGASSGAYYDWNTGMTYGGCIACGSSGICPTCRGGCYGQKQFRPISDSYRAQLLNNLRSIMQGAAARQGH